MSRLNSDQRMKRRNNFVDWLNTSSHKDDAVHLKSNPQRFGAIFARHTLEFHFATQRASVAQQIKQHPQGASRYSHRV